MNREMNRNGREMDREMDCEMNREMKWRKHTARIEGNNLNTLSILDISLITCTHPNRETYAIALICSL